MCNVATPVLLTVTVGVEFPVPINTFPKLMEAGDTDAIGGVTPLPESATETGLLLASLLMVSVAEPEPTDLGPNATWMMHVLPAPRAPRQPLVVTRKSRSPLIDAALMVIAPDPVLVTDTVCDGLCAPTAWLPKLTAVGDTEAVAGLTPVPERGTETEPLLASLVMVNVAEPIPEVRG